MSNEVRQIVVSLPKRNGDNIKRLLREVASSESRSISNMVCLILTDWLREKGYEVDDLEEQMDAEDEPEIDKDEPDDDYEISTNPMSDGNGNGNGNGNRKDIGDDDMDPPYFV